MIKYIAIDARGYSTSTGRYVRKLIDNLEVLDKGNRYFVLLKSENWDKYKPGADNFSKVRADFKEFTFAEQLGLLKLLDSLKVDLVHFTMPNQPIFYRGKTLTTIHDLTRLKFDNNNSNLSLYDLRKLMFKHVIKRVARQSSMVITPSKFVKDEVVDFANINPDKVVVTYEAADQITEPAVTVDTLVGQQYLLYVGQAYGHKNLQNLVKAFIKVQSTHSGLKLAIAGRKTVNHVELEDWVNSQNIESVVFTDYIDDAKLRWLYENCAAYVFPSLSEGFGLPGLEAMAHGAPVVSSNATCLPEIYGDAAIYFDPNDVDDMTGKIMSVLNNKKLRIDLIKKGHKQASKYTWHKTAEQTLECYSKVLL